MNLTLRGYLKETRRPVYSAALILPFLVAYHAGIILLNTSHINGADALIIRILSALSVHSMFASALVLIAYFTIWQLRSRASLIVKTGMMLVTLLESLCFALLLLFTFGWVTRYLHFAAGEKAGGLADIVLFCGAGIYEELVFRALLLGLLIASFGLLFRLKAGAAATAAALAGALLFSAFHYIGPAADSFTLNSFLQRAAGGLYFSVLFVTRGFGITAAAHALYDIMVGVVLT